MRTSAVLTVLAAALSLGACSTVKETLKGPELAPMGYPAGLAPMTQQIIAPHEATPASANSLWRSGARTFFNDQRANKIGDILTVAITIDDSAQTSNQTTRSRANSLQAGVPHLFGLESSLGKILPGASAANLIGVTGSNSTDGKGVMARSEKISLTIAAVVTAVLPNGNLVIQGRQEVRTNNEVRELTVAGIVRPEDISSANTIRHTQIAEARISYGGRGDVSRIQKAPAAQALAERFSPF